MSFNEGNLHDKVDGLERENAELRELLYDAVVRAQTAEIVADVSVLDARFYDRLDALGIEVER